MPPFGHAQGPGQQPAQQGQQPALPGSEGYQKNWRMVSARGILGTAHYFYA